MSNATCNGKTCGNCGRAKEIERTRDLKWCLIRGEMFNVKKLACKAHVGK